MSVDTGQAPGRRVTTSLQSSPHEGREEPVTCEYRSDMSGDREMLGLVIVIYGTLLALLAWIFHMVRSTPHPHLHAKAHPRETAAKR